MSKSMAMVRGISVPFPFEPYDVQLDYMNCTIESCQEGKYALLESPTGTGKTLSLLCSALSWHNTQGSTSQIVYSSRTHSQLSNVVKELKKTNFKPTVAHIASRKILCINDSIRHLDNYILTRICHEKRAKKECRFANDANLHQYANEVLLPRIDIEEYIKICRSKNICPYYAAQINAEKADLILSPYSYIVDKNVRNFLPVSALTNNILIFDEAHNFVDSCTDNMSSDVYFASFNSAFRALDNINPSTFEMAVKTTTVKVSTKDLKTTTFILKKLDQYFEDLQNKSEEFMSMVHEAERNKKEGTLYIKKTINDLYSILSNCGIFEENVGMISNVIDVVLSKGTEIGLLNTEYSGLYSVFSFFRTVFPDNHKDVELFNKYYTICLTSDLKVSVICFSPKESFSKLKSFLPKTIILTSGTLSPLKSLEDELGHVFPIKLECNHIINMDQVIVAVANTGPTNIRLNCTYNNRKNNPGLKKELVYSVAQTVNAVPNGSLVFFPSFSFLTDMSADITNACRSSKTVYTESRDTSKQATVFKNYQNSASKGSVLLSVCRGKASEGLDFADELARSVTIVGIPFPNLKDYKVQLKKEWLDEQSHGKGTKWYTENAIKAVNQSIGRAIRNKDDYAVIILLDERYTYYKDQLSHWVQNSIHVYDDFNTLVEEIKYFFKFKSSGMFSAKTGTRIKQFLGMSSKVTHTTEDEETETFSVDHHSNYSDDKPFIAPTIVHLKTKKKPEKIKPTINSLSSLLGTKAPPKRHTSSNNLLAGLLTTKSSSSSKSIETSHSCDELKKKEKKEKKERSEVEHDKERKEKKKEKKEKKVCVVCKKKDDLKIMNCGHYICKKCSGFYKLMNLPCPVCKREKTK